MSPAAVAKEWWPWLRKYTLAVTALSVTAGAIVAVMNAVGILEPYWISTHGHTRLVVVASEIRMVEFARDNLQREIDALELRLKNSDNSREITQQILSEQIDRRKAKMRLLESKLRDLHRKESDLR